jgi:hypothetical protein
MSRRSGIRQVRSTKPAMPSRRLRRYGLPSAIVAQAWLDRTRAIEQVFEYTPTASRTQPCDTVVPIVSRRLEKQGTPALLRRNCNGPTALPRRFASRTPGCVGSCGFLADNAALPQNCHNVNIKTTVEGCRGALSRFRPGGFGAGSSRRPSKRAAGSYGGEPESILNRSEYCRTWLPFTVPEDRRTR